MTTWIPVKERLPEVNEYVMCFALEYGRFLGWREDSLWGRKSNYLWKAGPEGTDGEYIALVTHWMPLPDSPRSAHVTDDDFKDEDEE